MTVQTRWARFLLLFLLASYGAAALGSVFTARSVETWYRALRRPAWTPPDWLFGPVWAVLYTAMALAVWLVWRQARLSPEQQRTSRAALWSWWAQLGLNVLWSAVFFGARSLSGALAVIAALWAAIALTAVLSLRVRPLAGLLLLPYLAWTSFAALLNYQIWRLNR
jgi:tryptophan-rich sensory protein